MGMLVMAALTMAMQMQSEQEGTFASLELRFQCGAVNSCPNSCLFTGGKFSGKWVYAGKTADTRPYYKWWDDDFSAWYYMYYDRDCDGASTWLPGWFVSDLKPNTLAVERRGRGNCGNSMHTTTGTSTSLTPISGAWHMDCNGNLHAAVTITITPNCTTTQPYSYTLGEWAPQQVSSGASDTTCGGKDERVPSVECAAQPGCCTDHNASLATPERRPQRPCDDDYANFVLSGGPPDPASIYKGNMYEGEWRYDGRTADGRPYYRWQAVQQSDYGENYGGYSYGSSTESRIGVFIYYDSDCDGDEGSTKVLSRWIIGIQRPSTTAKHDLDGDGVCYLGGYMKQASTSLTPSTSSC